MKKHAAATAADPRTTLAAAIPSMDLLTCLDKIDDSTNGEPPRFIALAVAFIFAVVVKALRMALQNMPEWRGAPSYDKQPNLRGCDRCVCTRCLHRKQRPSRLLEDYVVRIDARGSGWNGTSRKMAAPRCLGIHEEREAVVAANLERANVAVQRTVIGHTEAQGVQYLDGLIFPVQHGSSRSKLCRTSTAKAVAASELRRRLVPVSFPRHAKACTRPSSASSTICRTGRTAWSSCNAVAA